MSVKDHPLRQSSDLVLIGDYLRAAVRGAVTASEPEPAPERREKECPGDGAKDDLLALMGAILSYCTYPEVDDLKLFVDELEALRRRWEHAPGPPPNEELAQVDQLLKQQRATKDALETKQREEIQDIVVIFHRAVAALSQGGRRNLSRLGALERDLDQVSRIGDLATLRTRLGKMLEYVRTEREEEKSQSAAMVEQLQRDFHALELTAPDTANGMAGRELALATLRRGWRAGVMVAAVHLDQIRSVAERHGAETAQRLVNEVLAQVASRVEQPYTAFAWDINALLLVFEGVADSEHMRRMIRHQLVAIPATYVLEVASRRTLFRFPHRWLVLSQAEEPDTEKVVAAVELFLASQQG